MKRIAILGSTGSIGTQCLDIVRENQDKYVIEGLSFGHNIDLARKQIKEFNPKIVVCAKEEDWKILKAEYPQKKVYYGESGLIELATSNCDMVLNSLIGMMGLVPTTEAIIAGKDIALANKETLVAGGAYVMELAKKYSTKILPVDSEHSAIFQCLMGNNHKDVKRILLTASGGPFRGNSLSQLEDVTLEQALKHPNWSMGKKITIDSATMMNKGLEVIEAKWLFDLEPDEIEVLVHKESIVHSMVEFKDTSVIAQLGLPDMRVPIGLALSYPQRSEYKGESLDFFSAGANLTFHKPDMKVFKCLDLAYEALRAGESYPVALNGANEVLVDLFLNNKIKFIHIQNILTEILEGHKKENTMNLENILMVDKEVRAKTLEIVRKKYPYN